MRTAEKQAIEMLATSYLDQRWEEGWGNAGDIGHREEFDKVARDFAEAVEAAIDDCWHDYRLELVARYV